MVRCLVLYLPALPVCLAVVQLLSPCSAQFAVVGPQEPILAMVGGDAELPCHLSPKMSAETMDLMWVRSSSTQLVHTYAHGQEDTPAAEYQGRTSILREDITVGKAGLQIRNLRASDGGTYLCQFHDGDFYAGAQVELKVAALGSDPHVEIKDYEAGGIRVECSSAGWYPEPQIQWRDTRGHSLPAEVATEAADPQGLYAVSAFVILGGSSGEEVSCVIRNPLLSQERSTMVSIAGTFFPSLEPWAVVLAVFLPALSLLLVGAWCFLRQQKKIRALTKEMERERTEKEAAEAEMQQERSTKESLQEELRWRKVQYLEMDVTLDPDTAHPHLFLYEDFKSVRLEDARQRLPEKPERFDSLPCVLGREAFTSGRHYWEVEVGDRTDWVIGVCREDVERKGFDPMTPENGFWAVELYGNGYWVLTPLRTPLPLAGPPRRVGVFLDYESGDVAFYNMTDGSLLYTFSNASFSGPLRAFFCLWSCGKKPLTVCQITDELEGVTVVADATGPSTEIPLSPMGEDAASGDTDMPHSKIISTQPGQTAP